MKFADTMFSDTVADQPNMLWRVPQPANKELGEMEWLVLATIGMMWAACVLPVGRRASARTSVETFERDMQLLAHAQGRAHGRWIVTPRKGVPFLGRSDRARVRARERRRRVLTFLLESMVISFLIGVVPPLRVMWWATASLGALMFAYVGLVLAVMARPTAAGSRAARSRVVDANDRPRPPASGEPEGLDEDSVHVVVVPVRRRLSAAGA